jgi:hypothetical protein
MLLDVSINGASIDIEIPEPFRLDLEGIYGRIEGFASERGVKLDGADVKELIPKMVRGIAGCEGGCPADAKGLASRGHAEFELEYVEGGILTAQTKLGSGESLVLKMFPDF